ncbi:hypothetical protein TNCV_557761 [Trichonephila clavipes]|nr:hypothetical protein TNCV_557761 [Trichonephila clavipes]
MGCSSPSILCDKTTPAPTLTRVRLQDEIRGKNLGQTIWVGRRIWLLAPQTLSPISHPKSDLLFLNFSLSASVKGEAIVL